MLWFVYVSRCICGWWLNANAPPWPRSRRRPWPTDAEAPRAWRGRAEEARRPRVRPTTAAVACAASPHPARPTDDDWRIFSQPLSRNTGKKYHQGIPMQEMALSRNSYKEKAPSRNIDQEPMQGILIQDRIKRPKARIDVFQKADTEAAQDSSHPRAHKIFVP